MTPRTARPLVITLAVLTVFVGLLVAGGWFVRSIVEASFRSTEGVRAVRILAETLLRDQLNEETGVRGFAATRERALLQPYFESLVEMPVVVSGVRAAIDRLNLQDAKAALDDAAATNTRWLREVARPIVAGKPGTVRLQLRGKVLVDRFRTDSAGIESLLAQRELSDDERAQSAVLLIGVFAAGAVGAVIIGALLFSVQQYRLGVRLEQQREQAEVQRRRSAELRAAYRAEKRVADTLAQAFVQSGLPQPAMLRLSATYVPAAEETKVGGDWYEAVELPGDRVLVVIGDVAGHGIEAAVAMNKARQVLLACALVDVSPGPLLARVNSELIRNNAPMITAVAGLADARSCEFSYAAAGHPPPILIEPGRAARLLDVGSLPLGVAPGVSYCTHRITTVSGAMLVLYTDGAIEHSRDVLAGEAMLLAAAESAAHGSCNDAARRICDAIFGTTRTSDDVAVLTIGFDAKAARRDTPAAAETAAVGAGSGHSKPAGPPTPARAA